MRDWLCTSKDVLHITESLGRESYLELSCQAMEGSCICLRTLLQAIGKQSVEDAKVGRKAGANIGNLLLVACLEDPLYGVIENQAIAMLLAQVVDQLPTRPVVSNRTSRPKNATMGGHDVIHSTGPCVCPS